MNIKKATEQVEAAVSAYLARDEDGVALIPQRMQRPIILMGPPGVGKTAIVGQVAERLHINFVSYSITHHTRQSALGLPYIAEADYGGRTYRVSRYTMSEIIAATYDAMGESGVPEGILFLDEVNCVSETLAPAMLQFLQYKTFGQHRLPPGWVVVTAGNPPEYNRAAREFDPAMLDRMKRIDVEPDLDVWLEYALSHGVHPAVTTYLQSKPESFFRIQASVEGTRMVTARGWEDLSRMLQALERIGRAADQDLVAQYLQDPDIAEDFSLYLGLFAKYRDDYKVEEILAGTAGEAIAERASKAPFDERIALVGLLTSTLAGRAEALRASEDALREAREDLVAAHGRSGEDGGLAGALAEAVGAVTGELRRADERAGVSEGRQRVLSERASLLREAAQAAAGADGDSFGAARKTFNDALSRAAERGRALSGEVDGAVGFVEGAFGRGEELLVLCTRLALEPALMHVVSEYGAPRLVEASRHLMPHDRASELLEEVRRLGDAAAPPA